MFDIGISGLTSSLIGISVSGLFMRYVRPGPRVLTGYLLFLIIFAGCAIGSFISFKCPKLEIQGFTET